MTDSTDVHVCGGMWTIQTREQRSPYVLLRRKDGNVKHLVWSYAHIYFKDRKD